MRCSIQNNLPQHPFVPFNNIAEEVAKNHIQSPLMRKLFLFFSRIWFILFGVAKHENRIRDCFARGENGYWAKYRRFNSIYCPEFFASCILTEQPEEAPGRKAAKLIVGTLRFRERLISNLLPVDYEGDKPLDMERYNYLFSRHVASSLRAGAVVHEVVEGPPSDYIIIAVEGIYYRLQVLHDKKIISIAELLEQIHGIIEDAKAQPKRDQSNHFSFGLLTVFHNKSTINLWAKLFDKSQPTIAQLTNALFFVAIDLHERPQSLEQLGRAVHRRNFHNRDYRRSMQIVVTGNGQAGITGDPSAGIGGGFVAKFLDDLAKECQLLEEELQASIKTQADKHFQRLSFCIDNLHQYQDQLAELEKKAHEQLYPDDEATVFRIDGIGKKDFSRFAVSIDGVFHAALHSAFKQCFGKVPNIGNFIGLRSIQHGEIYRYNSTTSEMKKFLAAPGVETLAATLRAHKALIKKIKQGSDPLYQCQMLLVTMYFRYEISTFGCLALVLLLCIFVKDFTRRFMNQDMWVSHIPEFPAVSLTGRPGVKLSFLKPPSLAGHYMIFDHHTIICFVSNSGRPSYHGHEAKFAAALHRSLAEIRNILSSQGEHPTTPAAQART